MESAAVPRARRERAWGWLDDRLGIGGLRYPVPEHANSLAYTLGGITLVSFVLLIVTGVYLAQFYDPTEEAAHRTVAYIIDTAFAGALIRSVHYWLAAAFTITLVLHMVRAFATGSFKAPREATWITGVLVKGGYTPNVIVVERGKPVRLMFRREETAACSEMVIFDDFGKSATLPVGETVAVELMPAEPGEYEFACQMGMLRGTLVVE